MENRILTDLSKNVAFTGYRPQKLPQRGNKEVQEELSIRLQAAIVDSLGRGYMTFLNGCMAGWDILAAESVLTLKPLYPQIICATVAPFRKSFFAGNNWTPEWKARALKVYQQSDIAFSLSENYARGVYYARDRFLIDHSSLVICFYDGKPGGTKYTVDYAKTQNREIINLAHIK